MTIHVEVRDLKTLPKPLLKELKRYTFGEDGWMLPTIRQIFLGRRTFWHMNAETGQYERIEQELSYSEASALIARTPDDEIMGWAMVRHPRHRTKEKKFEFDWGQHRTVWSGKYEYGGRRPDFMVYVRPKFRRTRVARSLLLVAYNNFGRVDCYPHDSGSRRFYQKNARFVSVHDTRDFTNAKYRTREV